MAILHNGLRRRDKSVIWEKKVLTFAGGWVLKWGYLRRKGTGDF